MATFVLVHGAYQGGWIWKPVATRLRAAGHVAYAPTLDGCAEKQHQVRRRHHRGDARAGDRATSSSTKTCATSCSRARARAAW